MGYVPTAKQVETVKKAAETNVKTAEEAGSLLFSLYTAKDRASADRLLADAGLTVTRAKSRKVVSSTHSMLFRLYSTHTDGVAVPPTAEQVGRNLAEYLLAPTTDDTMSIRSSRLQVRDTFFAEVTRYTEEAQARADAKEEARRQEAKAAEVKGGNAKK
jgi:hypothetical protein